jgi:toxin secretion/phage lysis holin
MEPSAPVSLFVALKNISYVGLFLVALQYLNLSHEAVVILGILLLVDVITGVWRAAAVDGVRSVKSSIGTRGALGKILVFIVPFVIAAAGRGAGVDLSPLASASLTIFIVNTAYSILGNVHSIGTGKPKVEYDALDYVYRKVGEVLKKLIPDVKPEV